MRTVYLYAPTVSPFTKHITAGKLYPSVLSKKGHDQHGDIVNDIGQTVTIMVYDRAQKWKVKRR